MFRAETASEIAPYLEADYWGGKMIGDKSPLGTQLQKRVSPVQASVGGVDIAMNSLEAVADQRVGLTATQIYMNGEAFSPDKHPAGSVVIYRKEVLEKNHEKAEKIQDKPDEIKLPFGLSFSNLPLDPNDEPGIERIVEPPYIYYSGGRLGILAAVTGTNQSELIYVSKVAKLSSKNGASQGLPKANIEPAPFVVGETRRRITKKGAELLIRVNALTVFQVNQKPKRRKIKEEKLVERDLFSGFFLPNQPSAHF